MKVTPYKNTKGETHYLIECPGCEQGHAFDSKWTYNGNPDRPTFSPSMKAIWIDAENKQQVCHFFLREGIMEFLGDCTHSKRGQKIELEDLNK